MVVVQTDVLDLHVAVHVILIVTIHQPIQVVVVQAHLVALHVHHTVKIHLIIPEDALVLHVVLPVVPLVKILLIIPLGDVLDLHAQVSVRVNAPLPVLKHVQATVPGSAAMDALAIVGADARTHVQAAVVDNAAYRAVVLAVVNVPPAVPHSALTSPKVVAVVAALEVAV